MAAIASSVKLTMITSLLKFKQAKSMWSYLKDHYVQDSGALQHTIMQQLHVIEQRDMSTDEYYSNFDSLMGSLISKVPQCTQQHRTAKHLHLLSSFWVRAEFNSIHTRSLHTPSTRTMAKALSDLLAEETRLQSLSSSVSQPQCVGSFSEDQCIQRAL